MSVETASIHTITDAIRNALVDSTVSATWRAAMLARLAKTTWTTLAQREADALTISPTAILPLITVWPRDAEYVESDSLCERYRITWLVRLRFAAGIEAHDPTDLMGLCLDLSEDLRAAVQATPTYGDYLTVTRMGAFPEYSSAAPDGVAAVEVQMEVTRSRA